MEKSIEENKIDEYKFFNEKLNEYSLKQIWWILKNGERIKKFFDYSSFDKKNQNLSFFTTFSNYLYFPYYKIGNKNQNWFNAYFSFISSFPSLYNFDKRIMNGIVGTFRFTDVDESKLLLSSGKNQNPSWSFGSDKWVLWSTNVLFDRKSYENLYIIWKNEDVIFDTGFKERISGKISNDDVVGECEIFIRKNAEPIIGGKVFTYTFKDLQEQFPFIPDNFKLDRKKIKDTQNGFETFDVLMNSFSKTEIEKYGYITENNNGSISYLTKSPENYFRGENKWNKSYVDFFTEMKNTCEVLRKDTLFNSTWDKKLILLIEQFEGKIEFWKKELYKTEILLELSLLNKYQLKYSVSKSKYPKFNGKTYPYYEYENGSIFEGTALIFS